MTEHNETQNEAWMDCPVCCFLSRLKDSETAKHFRNARREMLLAAKSAVEAGLDCLDREEAQTAKPQAQKVEIS